MKGSAVGRVPSPTIAKPRMKKVCRDSFEGLLMKKHNRYCFKEVPIKVIS